MLDVIFIWRCSIWLSVATLIDMQLMGLLPTNLHCIVKVKHSSKWSWDEEKKKIKKSVNYWWYTPLLVVTTLYTVSLFFFFQLGPPEVSVLLKFQLTQLNNVEACFCIMCQWHCCGTCLLTPAIVCESIWLYNVHSAEQYLIILIKCCINLL